MTNVLNFKPKTANKTASTGGRKSRSKPKAVHVRLGNVYAVRYEGNSSTPVMDMGLLEKKDK